MERLRDWLRAHSNLLVLLGLTLFSYAASISRFQPLPWAIAALLTATLIAGVFWPYWLVRHLSVQRKGPDRAEEGETIVFQVEIENRGWLPRFMVELMDRLPFVGTAQGEVAHGEKVLGVISYVPGSARRRFEMPLLCEKRGFYELGPVGLASSFPLGLVEVKRRHNEGVQTLTIYPDVFNIVSLPLKGAASQIHRGGYLLPEGSGAAEFSGLREYRRGDNPRHIHWPTTARTNELMVKEYEPLASACLHIALDFDAAANAGSGRHATLEYALRIAGSIARFATSTGLRVRVSGERRHPLRIPAGTGELHYRAILDELAIADADGALPYSVVLSRMATQIQAGETVVVFLSGPPGREQELLQSLALLRARHAHLYAVLFDRATFEDPANKVSRGGTPPSAVLHGSLLELSAYCVPVRNGDDLTRLFNP